ncbi:MAG: 50S ribosomal protein L6 [Gemmatimonadota bacterium]
MSRVGRQPVPIPEAAEVRVAGSTVVVKGPRGELSREFDPDMQIEVDGRELRVQRPTDQARHRSLHGLTRSLIANMVTGVTEGFERSLEIHGVGYRAQQRGKSIVLNVGFSHPVDIHPPDGVELAVESPTLVRVRGVDKQKVGQIAAEIRAVRPPEPYKGKGIRYQGEQVRRKAGKSTAGGLG